MKALWLYVNGNRREFATKLANMFETPSRNQMQNRRQSGDIRRQWNSRGARVNPGTPLVC
jgi:hypothetical protein